MHIELPFLVFFMVLILPGIATVFKKCEQDSTYANITQVRVKDCDRLPCIFRKGKSYNIEVDATALKSISNLPYIVSAKVVFPITLFEGNACGNLTLGRCPLSPNDKFTFAADFEVGNNLPKINSEIVAKVRNDKKDMVLCIKLDVQIKP